uniref:Reverse transcriptase domain-containing protein n=1 Tax=Tanacetum cinerariifolium TaxID=118510 RepID=A0A6L2JZ65_TANCI|nr:hypothetical protein [Tanacetum cinerariifolium]
MSKRARSTRVHASSSRNETVEEKVCKFRYDQLFKGATFRLGGLKREMSLLEFGWRISLYSERESGEIATLSRLRGALTVNSNHMNHLFWPSIGDGREGIICNIPYWLAKCLKGVREKSVIFRGMFAMKIARSFGLLMEEMVRLLSCEPHLHVYRKTSLVNMEFIIELHEGVCCWPNTRGIIDEVHPPTLPVGFLVLLPPLSVHPPVIPPRGATVDQPALRVVILGSIIYMRKDIFNVTNSLLEEFADELALISYPPDYDDNRTCDIESDIREMEFLLYQGEDFDFKDSIDQSDLTHYDDLFVDPTPEMFTEEQPPDYLFLPRFDVYPDDFLEIESDAKFDNDSFDSKREKIKEVELLIDQLDLPCDILSEYNSFNSQDFSRDDVLPSPNNEDKVFNPGILIHERSVKIITRFAQEKKFAVSFASWLFEDSDPPFYETTSIFI